MNTKKKSAIAVSAILLFSFISMIPYKNVYAQSSADFQLFESSNTSDDECYTGAITGGISWIGCYASSSTTLRINAMSGNSTLATTTIASQSNTSTSKFFPSGTDSIIYVDTSGASEVVRKYTLSGSTISNTASLTLSGCAADTSMPSAFSTTLVYQCDDGSLKLINMNTMVLTSTYTTLIQGNCANPNGAYMMDSSKGVVWCDNSELYAFTVSGSTITFTDSLTGLTSAVQKQGLITGGYVWLASRSALTAAQVIGIDTSTMTFTTTPLTLPSGSSIVSLLVVGKYIITLDRDGNNIYIYDYTLSQPSVAVANILIPYGIGTSFVQQINTSDSVTFIISTTIPNVGRYIIMENVIIDGIPLGGIPPSSETGGVDCTLSQNSNILICRIVGQTGGNIGGLGGIIDNGIFNIFTNSGLIDGSDTNPQTNGVGYFITAVSFMLMIGVFFVASKNNLDRIPNYIYMIVSIAILGGLTAIGWIDPTLLILGIIIISGLAVAKYRDVLSGSFSGGDFR